MPNAQGGMTAEEEAAWIAERLRGSQYTPTSMEGGAPEGVLAAIEQQVQEPAFIGIGPPYTESARPYSGPPPLDPGIWTEAMGTAPEPGDLRYEGGVAMPVNWQDYNTGNTSTGGGFFTLDQIFARGGMREAFQSGSGTPSTNNWRLIPGGRPGMIMRNGQIIDTNELEWDVWAIWLPQHGRESAPLEQRWQCAGRLCVGVNRSIDRGLAWWCPSLARHSWHLMRVSSCSQC